MEITDNASQNVTCCLRSCSSSVNQTNVV